MATAFMVVVGATTARYATVIKEMNVIFSGQVMVASNDTIVIQAIPITRGSLPMSLASDIQSSIPQSAKSVPILFITSINLEGIIQPVPPNFTIGVSTDNIDSVFGDTILSGNLGHFPANESSYEVVVGGSLAEQYYWSLGSQITINGYDLNVTGILDTKLALLNRGLIMPLAIAQQIYNFPESVNIVIVRPAEGYAQDELANAIEHKYPYVEALTEDKRNDVIQPVLEQVGIFNVGIETVVLVMSLILVMTVTLMSVSERRRDFATLDAIGAPKSYVLRLVVLEASLIGVIAAALGIGFGSVGSIIFASLYTNIPLAQFFPSLFEVVPPMFMLEIFLMTIATCCFGGILPAINASRMHIAEEMRAEY